MRKFAVFEGLSLVQVMRFCGVRAKVDRDASRVVISLDVDQGGMSSRSCRKRTLRKKREKICGV